MNKIIYLIAFSIAILTANAQSFSTKKAKAEKTFILEQKLKETSGLITNKNLLWTHNDDTDTLLYGISPEDGKIIAQTAILGVKNRDWEEISTNGTSVFIGDFGNNAHGNRTDLKILRFPLAALGNAAVQPQTISFSYPEQTSFAAQSPNTTRFDCEAFVCQQDSLYLFTKEWQTGYTSLYALPNAPGTQSATLRGRFRTHCMVTAAHLTPDGKRLVLLGYDRYLRPYAWLFWNFEGRNFWSGKSRKLRLRPFFLQCEGISSFNGGVFFISNEKFSHRFLPKRPAALRIFNFEHFFE